MTATVPSRRLLPAAGLLALALFGTACDPADTTTGTAAPPPAAVSAAPTAPASSEAPSPAGSPAASPSESPTPSLAPSTAPPTAAAPAPARTAAPAPVRTTAAPRPAPTTAAAHPCAHHTTGACGWDLGVSPASSGETAECNDGTASFSATFSGTCSHHGGVRYWFK
ncbi:uncharacterized protein DUF3761 [Streptomyces sp. TLI_235]|nr:DUF3761 domain-containing protein [Streptomyces sp. TLI_235]PBC76186.1 uncharacterized protein DUF3761 [Streptomyces sp. TLI_235]